MQTHFFQGLSEWQKDCLLFFWAKDLLVEEEMEKGPLQDILEQWVLHIKSCLE